MNYKSLSYREENFDFLIRSKNYSNSTFIDADELPDYLGFDVYEFLTDCCLKFAQNVEIQFLDDANKAIGIIYEFFNSNKEKLSSSKIDFSKIIKIFCETEFLHALFYAVNELGEGYIPNCAAFICIVTYLSDKFVEILSEKDFIYPLTNYYMDNYQELSIYQRSNIFNSINNLFKYYQDKSFSVIFDNPKGNFFVILDAFGMAVNNFKLLKFLYWILINGNNTLRDIYPLIFKYFASKIAIIFEENVNEKEREDEEEEEEESQEPDEKIILFSMTLLLIYRLLKNDQTIIDFVFKTEILVEISRLYSKNYEKLSSFKEIIINYYQLISLVINCYDKDANEENELYSKEIIIFEYIKLEDIKPMLRCTIDPKINNSALSLIDVLIKKKLFERLFQNEKLSITEDILDLLDDFPFETKKLAFLCLCNIFNLNYTFYGESILKRIQTSYLCDLISSEDYILQKKIFDFIDFALIQADFQNSSLDQNSLKKSFALNILEDDELYDCIQSFSCPDDKDLEIQAFKILHKINFWVKF